MNVFLSGWAIPPQKFDGFLSIDSTKIVAEYKNIENIAQNSDNILPSDIDILAAWSMGAIIALGVLGKIKAKNIILLSPTLKFAASGEVSAQLDMLKENVRQNKETALKLFFRKCGISKELPDLSYYSERELLCGLDFLANTEIRTPLPYCDNAEFSVICGENDKIISAVLSAEVAQNLNVKPIVIGGGSHFSAVEFLLSVQNNCRG